MLAGKARIALGITEPGGGSDVARIRTTARRDGDVYVVNGSKTFISGVMGADWVSTAVRTGGDGAGGVSMLLIPTKLPGVSRTPLDRKQGWWCADTGTIYFDEARVPVRYLIGQEGEGFKVIMKNFNSERLVMSATMEFCAREASQILGDASYLRGSRVERFYREVRVNAIGGGSEEIMRDLAANRYCL